MGQEFTNELAQTPLWRFAIRVYPHFKSELLSLQTSHQLPINDLLALAFGLRQGYQLDNDWWHDTQLVPTRDLISRVRRLRESLKGHANYERAKILEVNLEAVDIMRLQQLFVLGSCDQNIEQFANHRGIKKGAIAPLIKRLSVY